MKVTITMHHDNPFFLREFVENLKKDAASALQAVDEDSYSTRLTLHVTEDILRSAGFSGQFMRMQADGHRRAVREAAANIKAAADRNRIRCWSILEPSPRDYEDRAVERAGGC